MITFKDKKILINGKPEIILSGEIHYYRLKKSNWQKVINELKETGCNAVATYIPWLCHEFEEGCFDLTGQTREEHAIKGFIELCQDNGLYIILRPGPFIMAEMKNEGIPYWVAKKYPHLKPMTWNGNLSTTPTLDYMHPDFLACVRGWFKQIISLISNYLICNDGKVIAIQLDNEIGMLSWVSNCPNLSDFNIRAFIQWLYKKYSDNASERYGFDITNFDKAVSVFRSPSEDVALRYHKDLGYFMREMFKRYVDVLKGYCYEFGIKDTVFLINIHGSGGSRATGYPMGIGQLYETYRNSEDTISGSDIYIGDIGINNFADIYLLNIFTDATNSSQQPLTSLEFEAGNGDYSFNYDMRYSPFATDSKTRMFIAQGNRLLNYYLFSGGENYRFERDMKDGNNRIAITGQKHGYAAPIDHLGRRNTVFEKNKEVVTTIRSNADKLAEMCEMYDNLVFSFIPDYYMTEYCYPKSKRENDFKNHIRRIQDGGLWNILAKSLLLTNHSFPAFDIQGNDLCDKVDISKTLVLTSCRFMSADIQQNVIRFLKRGGNAFIYGELPFYDMEGNPCSLIADYLGVKLKRSFDFEANNNFSIYPCGEFEGKYFEIPSSNAIQTIETDNADVFLRVYENDEVCGFYKEIGNSKIVCMTTFFNCQLGMLKTLFEKVEIRNRLSHDYMDFHGIFMTRSANIDNEQYLHIINLDEIKKEVNVYDFGENIFGHTLLLKPHGCAMLPLNLKPFGGDSKVTILKSTAEIYKKDISGSSICFRPTQVIDTIVIQDANEISVIDETRDCYKIIKEGRTHIIKIKSKLLNSDCVNVHIE